MPKRHQCKINKKIMCLSVDGGVCGFICLDNIQVVEYKPTVNSN